MNFSVGKNDKPDELPSGGVKESPNHIIRQAPNPLHRWANYAAITMTDTHRYNPAAKKISLSTALKRVKTCRYP